MRRYMNLGEKLKKKTFLFGSKINRKTLGLAVKNFGFEQNASFKIFKLITIWRLTQMAIDSSQKERTIQC